MENQPGGKADQKRSAGKYSGRQVKGSTYGCSWAEVETQAGFNDGVLNDCKWLTDPLGLHMRKSFLISAATFGTLAVLLGAFGAHGLSDYVLPEMLHAYMTGVAYQFYHVFALFTVGILYERIPTVKLVWAGRMFITGIVLFSGSLYALTLLHVVQASGWRYIGIVTPIGGMFFIAGWLMLLLGVYRTHG